MRPQCSALEVSGRELAPTDLTNMAPPTPLTITDCPAHKLVPNTTELYQYAVGCSSKEVHAPWLLLDLL